MYTTHVFSINNGWGLLTEQHPEEWQSIQEILLGVTVDIINKPSLAIRSKESVEINDENNCLGIQDLLKQEFGDNMWQPVTFELESSEEVSYSLDMVRARVACYPVFTRLVAALEISRVVFTDTPLSIEAGVCDVSVIIVPSDDMNDLLRFKQLSFGQPYFQDDCLLLIDTFKKSIKTQALAFLFVSAEQKDLVLEEWEPASNPSVNRSIEFPPEYYQAGVSALSNFGEVLRHRYPDIKLSIRIEQEANVVRMHIELPNGEVDIVEEVLEKYFMVVQDKAPASSIFDNKLQALLLESRIESLKGELRNTVRAYELALATIGEMKVSHEQAVENFQQIIGQQAHQITSLIGLSSQQATSHERIQLAQIGHTGTLFKDLLGEARDSQATVDAINTLRFHLTSSIAAIDAEDRIKDALNTIQQEKPNLLQHLAGQIESAGFGALGGIALDWLLNRPK